MSYDLTLDMQDFNCTSNYREMFQVVFAKEAGIKILDGMTAIESVGVLESALVRTILNHDHLKRIQPENDWGTYRGLINILVELRDFAYETCCHENGMTTWGVTY